MWVFTGFTAVCFYAAALGPLEPRKKGYVALAGVVSDWVPFFTGWMQATVELPRSLFYVHISFGVVGYSLLLYCLLAWLRGRERPLRVRAGFVGLWSIAYLAGFGLSLLRL